ncbi:Solute carrier family 13 member 3 [Hypsibius exemplaris]|uniref:Solute carrier family 13 member 3 n=1 Tax=Hypsibius exemplaris TaxID=2072580 RepID=A0A1W0WH67_HYPEX|nr:Solute carrier family 13 member 3 [Hypsibius exemplaris]
MASLKKTFRLIPVYWRLVTAILMPLLLSPIILTTDSKSAKAGYLLTLLTVYMVLELLPIAGVVLLTLFLVPTIGLATTSEFAKYFMNDTMFLFLSVLIMAISIEEVNLHNRLALLALRTIGVSPSRLILGFLLISGFLSMWMSNFAVTLMILPIAVAVTETLTPEDPPLSTPEDPPLLTSRSHSRRPSVTFQEYEENRAASRHGSAFLAKRRASNVSIAPFTHEMLFAAIEETSAERADANEATAFLDESIKELGHRSPIKVVVTEPEETEETRGKMESARELTKAFQLSIAYGANIGGMATLIGTYNNMLLRMIVEGSYGTDTAFNFLSFSMVAAPIVFLALFTTWLIFCVLYVPGWLKNWRKARPDSDKAALRTLNQKLHQLGPIKNGEISVLIIFGCVITLWLTRDPKVVPGWGALFAAQEYATDALPVMLGTICLFIVPADFKAFFSGSYEPILQWQRVVARLPWDFFLFAGCLMTLMKLSEVYGLIDSLGAAVPDLSAIPPIVVMLLVSLFGSLISEVMGGGLVAAILLPIFANIAEMTGVNPLYYMMAIALSTQMVFLTPISSFPTLIVYNSGTVTFGEIVKSGIGPKIACLAILLLSLELLGWLVMDIKVFPDWAQQRLASRTGASWNSSATLGTTEFPFASSTNTSWIL